MHGKPTGICECGCGRATSVVDRTAKALGLVKGEFRRYVKGHQPKALEADLTRYHLDAVTGCWVWQGALTAQGYGAARFDRRYAAAHRAVWLDSGREIPDGMHLHHECRNRACVNPDHLTLVDQPEHATLHARELAKLTLRDARDIRERAARTGEAAGEIAPDYGVTRSAITAVLRGDRWLDAGGPLRRRPEYTQLTPGDVAEIKRRAGDGERHRDLAREFQVSHGRISRVISGKTYKRRQRMISPASSAQRAKVKAQVCAVCEQGPCDPAHLTPRSFRGCDDADCVIALCRLHHEAFDNSTLDLCPHLSGAGFERELAHMQGHYSDPLSVLIRLSGCRWVPEPKTEGTRC